MSNEEKFPHYFKQIPEGVTHVDVYHVLRLFAVDDGAIAHALKKLLCAGKRGSKGRQTDISEAIASLTRCLELDALEKSDQCNECDPEFPCSENTEKPCIRQPVAPNCIHENEYQCQDCMLLKCEESSVIHRDDGDVRCNNCSSLNRLSTPVIQFNAIGDMNPAGVINKSRDSGHTLITSVRVRDCDHALDIIHGLDTAIRELVTFYWFNEAMGMNGKWCSYSHTEF